MTIIQSRSQSSAFFFSQALSDALRQVEPVSQISAVPSSLKLWYDVFISDIEQIHAFLAAAPNTLTYSAFCTALQDWLNVQHACLYRLPEFKNSPSFTLDYTTLLSHPPSTPRFQSLTEAHLTLQSLSQHIHALSLVCQQLSFSKYNSMELLNYLHRWCIASSWSTHMLGQSQSLFMHTLQPLLHFLERLLIEGTATDPFNEFFIAKNKQPHSFSLSSVCPIFLLDVHDKILTTAQSISVAKEFDISLSAPLSLASIFSDSILNSFDHFKNQSIDLHQIVSHISTYHDVIQRHLFHHVSTSLPVTLHLSILFRLLIFMDGVFSDALIDALLHSQQDTMSIGHRFSGKSLELMFRPAEFTLALDAALAIVAEKKSADTKKEFVLATTESKSSVFSLPPFDELLQEKLSQEILRCRLSFVVPQKTILTRPLSMFDLHALDFLKLTFHCDPVVGHFLFTPRCLQYAQSFGIRMFRIRRVDYLLRHKKQHADRHFLIARHFLSAYMNYIAFDVVQHAYRSFVEKGHCASLVEIERNFYVFLREIYQMSFFAVGTEEDGSSSKLFQFLHQKMNGILQEILFLLEKSNGSSVKLEEYLVKLKSVLRKPSVTASVVQLKWLADRVC